MRKDDDDDDHGSDGDSEDDSDDDSDGSMCVSLLKLMIMGIIIRIARINISTHFRTQP